jgi:orotate phosphoribosyltransferase
METIKKHLASKLLQINAIKFNPEQPFTWASGIRSPIYCDNRLTLSYPDVRNLICTGFQALAEPLEYDLIAGVATGGIAHGMLLADRLEKPFIYIRSASKGHGLQNAIEGKLDPGAKVLVIEDLISTGGSSMKAIQAVQDAGGIVTDLLAISSYGFAVASELFSAHGVNVSVLTDYNTLVEVGIRENFISAQAEATLSAWNKDPENWFK